MSMSVCAICAKVSPYWKLFSENTGFKIEERKWKESNSRKDRGLKSRS
jgi:hypothetical protein